MYSNFDKAAVAIIMALVQIANVFGFHWGLDQATVTTVVATVTPLLVWIVPNLPKDA